MLRNMLVHETNRFFNIIQKRIDYIFMNAANH